MESMLVRMPVAVKAKVTEDLKLKIIADLEKTIKEMKLDLEGFERQAKAVMNSVIEQGGPVEQVSQQVAAEREKRQNALQEAVDKMAHAEKLEMGQEISNGTLERMVELKIGDDLNAIVGAEILVEDGKIIAFRA